MSRPTRDDVARVLFLIDRGDSMKPGKPEEYWDAGIVAGEVRDRYYRFADAVLALPWPDPTDLATAWDEGHHHGWLDRAADPGDITATNPYRPEETP